MSSITKRPIFDSNQHNMHNARRDPAPGTSQQSTRNAAPAAYFNALKEQLKATQLQVQQLQELSFRVSHSDSHLVDHVLNIRKTALNHSQAHGEIWRFLSPLHAGNPSQAQLDHDVRRQSLRAKGLDSGWTGTRRFLNSPTECGRIPTGFDMTCTSQPLCPQEIGATSPSLPSIRPQHLEPTSRESSPVSVRGQRVDGHLAVAPAEIRYCPRKQEDVLGATQKYRCTLPGCGKLYKDINAHLLTHQHERPLKCPLVSCEYSVRGFSRKHDRNRHVLVHFEGLLSCSICRGVGTATEKRFYRVDMLKRHMSRAHRVNGIISDDRGGTAIDSTSMRDGSSDAVKLEARCTTCRQIFSGTQLMYDHLDGCIQRIVGGRPDDHSHTQN